MREKQKHESADTSDKKYKPCKCNIIEKKMKMIKQLEDNLSP